MPSPSLFALLDDIATILDDVALLTKVASKKTASALDDVGVLTKVATKKTAGVLGDDLALNAQQVTGVRAERELPVVWAVAKGSLVNKAILVPAALAISAFIPWAITPLLVVGGAFLCFEGSEKVVHRFLHSHEEVEEGRAKLVEAVANPNVDLVEFERQKIKGAIFTDFILSAEIVVIALGTVATAPLLTRIGVLVAIALVMTVGVYGFVAAIVKLDDLGQLFAEKSAREGAPFGGLQGALAKAILWSAPWLMKALSVAGTVAMFLVGGGIVAHAIPHLHELVHHAAEPLGVFGAILPTVVDLAVGVVTGLCVLGVFSVIQRLRSAKSASA